MLNGPQVTSDGLLEIAVNGTSFDANNVQKSAYTPATFNLRDPAGKQLQAYITDYTINTALEAGFLTGNTLDITYLLKEYLNVTVTTDNLGAIIPQILTKYGSGKAVGLAGKFTQSKSKVTFGADSSSVTGNLQVTVSVGSDTAILAEFVGVDGSAFIKAANGDIYGNIGKASLGTIGAFQTSLGFTKEDLLSSLQGQLDQTIVEANANLTAGVPVPEIMGINFGDIDIKGSAGLLELGLSVSAEFWNDVSKALYRAPKASYAVATSPEEIKFLQY